MRLKSIFCVSKFQKKMGKYAASIERSKQKVFRPPELPTKGSVLGPPL